MARKKLVGPSPCAENALVFSQHRGSSRRQGHMGRKSGVDRDVLSIFGAIANVVRPPLMDAFCVALYRGEGSST